MKRNLLLLLLGLFTLCVTSFAQSDNVPQAVKETFTKQYPAAENVEYKDNLLNVWVNFTLNGDTLKANYTKKGVWENTEKAITYDQLPEAVKDGFQKSKYADREVEETKIIYRAGGTERYRLKTRKNDLQKKYLYFNEKGQLVEDSIAI
jgi:hypothetical protein